MNNIANEFDDRISFVVITLLADRYFWGTINSIQSEISPIDEIVIVAPKTTCIQVKPELDEYDFSASFVIDRQEGIYPAQNLGVQQAKHPWICVVNSGDYILPSCRERFMRSIQGYPSAQVHCFAQQVIDANGNVVYTSYPRQHHFLSHQSIVYRRSLHYKYGLYDTSFLYCADQLFFAKLYAYAIFSCSDSVTSAYQLGGFSDTFSLRLAYESYTVRRLLNQGKLRAITRSYLSPLIRCIADKLMPGASTALRLMVYRIRK